MLHHPRAGHAGQGKHRADGQINAAGNDDGGHADGDDGVDAGAAEDVQEIVGGEKCVRLEHGQKNQHEQQTRERQELADEFHVTTTDYGPLTIVA